MRLYIVHLSVQTELLRPDGIDRASIDPAHHFFFCYVIVNLFKSLISHICVLLECRTNLVQSESVTITSS